MLLVFDIGNSSISIGVFEFPADDRITEKNLVHHFKISSKSLSADEYALLIYHFLELKNIHPSHKSPYFQNTALASDLGAEFSRKEVTAAVISSVVPAMTGILARAAEDLIGRPPFIIGPGIRTGLGIRIKNPEQLGADIVSNAAFATEAAGSSDAPILVLDVGTATTLTAIDKNKDILGTIIMPGLRISLSALSGSAAQLNDISLSESETDAIPLIGRDSTESVRSGVVNGHRIMIDGFVRNLREYFAAQGETQKLCLVSTGGLSHLIVPHMRNKFTDYPSLTLLGAAKIYLLNNKVNKNKNKDFV